MSLSKKIHQKIIFLILLIIILLASPFVSAFTLKETQFQKIRGPSDSNYILPNQNIDIFKYKITLTPHFNNSFTFDANTIIECSVTNNTVDAITLHAKNLVFLNVKIVYETGNPQIIDPIPEIDDKYDLWTLKLNRRLAKNAVFTIEVNYKGMMSDDFYGFYKTSYEEKGQTKWMGTTQFQPIHARRVFPCFDEPKYKSKFAITIRRPKGFQPSMSNMKMIGKGIEGTVYVEENFYETPKMSTYLLAFIVSELEAASKTNNGDADQFGIWARKEAQDQGNYAFKVTKNLVESMVQYLMYPISKMDPNLKNDHVAIPEMASGAMENWGLITYREANLMYREDESSVRFKQQVTVGAAHEIAHSWFGNLVTCHWWSELWLNEGFATFFQIFLPDRIGEQMDMEVQFNVGQLHPAMMYDAFRNSPPLKTEVYSPDEIYSQFNPLTYNKGAALIRMIRDFVGARTFQNALIRYMNETDFQTTNEEILCKFIQDQADNDRSIESYVNTNVYSFVTSWTNYNGFPLLTVAVDRVNKKISIEQKRFMKDLDGPSPTSTWHIPITYTTRMENNFDEFKPKFIFTDAFRIIENVRINEKDWIIFNVQQSSYYRVLYDDTTLKLIIEGLSNEDREYIHPQNRAQIVDDLFNFAQENMYKYTSLLDAIQFLELESHFAPWSAAFTGYSNLRLLIQSIPNLQKSLDKHILTVMKKTLLPKLEFNENNNDKHIDKLFRINSFNLACQLDYKECIDESKKIFEDFKNNKHTIKPNLREYVYCTALKYGTGEDFDVLWKRYLTANVMNEKQTILNALGCSNHADKLIKLLFYTISQNSPIRKQDKLIVFNSIISGGSINVEIAFEFIQENVKTIRIVYGPNNLQIMLNNLPLRMTSDQLAKFEIFIYEEENYLTMEEKEIGIDGMRTAKTNINKAKNLEPDLQKWIDNKYNSASILGTSWLLITTMLLLTKFDNFRSR